MTGLQYLATLAIMAFFVGLAAAWQQHEKLVADAARTLAGIVLYSGQLLAGIVVFLTAWALSPVSAKARQYKYLYMRSAAH